MMSASDHLANWCCVMVLPVPNPPGMAAVPPLPSGKNVSMIRWPVTSGSSMRSRSRMGRAVRTGQDWTIVRSRGPSAVSTLATGSSIA